MRYNEMQLEQGKLSNGLPKKKFNIVIVLEDGSAVTITNKEAVDKQEALIKEINDPWHRDRIVSITIFEAKRYSEKEEEQC